MLHILRKRQRIVAKSLSRAPEGSLYISVDGQYLKYRWRTNENGVMRERSIGKEGELIRRLARKRYLQEELSRIKSNIALLEKACSKSVSLEPDEIVKALPKGLGYLDRELFVTGRNASFNWPHPSRSPDVSVRRPVLDTGLMSPEEWAALPYRENTSYLQYKKQLSPRGFLCRSKSEVAIAGRYDVFRIPFHCDETILIDTYELAPDFIGARADGKLIYHEHCGLHDDGYRSNFSWKLSLYDSVGIRPGQNLIITYDREDSTLNLELVDAFLKAYYFC